MSIASTYGEKKMNTSRRLTTFILLTLMLTAVLVTIPAPVNAAPPEDISFHLDVIFQIGNLTGTGSWESDGVVTSSGNIEQSELHAGWTEEGLPRTVHALDTLSDASGTITIRAEITQIEHEPFKSFKGAGRWVIISGTGAYENLRGEGPATIEGTVNFPIDLTLRADYDGVAHFAP
jgi:hypothetical protein